MLEILAIFYLCRLNGRIVERKGHKSGRYKLLTVLLWIGGELLGGVLALILVNGSEATGLVYLFALGGAVAGAALSCLMVNRLPPAVPAIQTGVFD
jgi:hypothetical protein